MELTTEQRNAVNRLASFGGTLLKVGRVVFRNGGLIRVTEVKSNTCDGCMYDGGPLVCRSIDLNCIYKDKGQRVYCIYEKV